MINETIAGVLARRAVGCFGVSRLALALAAVFTAAGCSPVDAPCDGEDTHEQIEPLCGGDFGYGDHDFNANEKAALRRAGERWNAFTGASLVSVHAGDATCRIVPGELPAEWAAYYDFTTGTITIDRSKIRRAFNFETLSFPIDSDDLETTAMHEIGHSLGLNHAQDGGIMCSQSNADFNESDRAQCTELGWCK